MSFGYDPEVPAGFQEADFEMAELEARARENAARRARGDCPHTWIQGGSGYKREHPEKAASIGLQDDESVCFHCGDVVTDCAGVTIRPGLGEDV